MNEDPTQQEKEEIDAAPIEAAIEDLAERVRKEREERELRIRTRTQSPSTDDTPEQEGEE